MHFTHVADELRLEVTGDLPPIEVEFSTGESPEHVSIHAPWKGLLQPNVDLRSAKLKELGWRADADSLKLTHCYRPNVAHIAPTSGRAVTHSTTLSAHSVKTIPRE